MVKKNRARAKRRRNKPKITLPGGVSIPQPVTQGARRDIDRDPQGNVLEARMRQTGLDREQVKGQMMGCTVGRRLRLDLISDKEELFEAVQHMRRVTMAYDRAIGAPQRHAKCMRIMVPPDRFEADASSPAPDLREPEERDRQAESAWVTMKAWLSCADYAARVACVRAVIDETDQPIADWSGVVIALRCVADGIKGRKMVDRARVVKHWEN